MIYAYARCSVSETDQERNRLIYAFQAAGAEKGVFEYEESDPAEKVTLEMLLEHVQPGDTIITTHVSRLSRSSKQFCSILDIVQEKRIRLIILGRIEVDCRKEEIDAVSSACLKMASVFSELESQIASASIKAGMVRAKENGKTIGRPRTRHEDIPSKFLQHYPEYEQGLLNKSELARVCGLSRPTVYKYLRMMRK